MTRDNVTISAQSMQLGRLLRWLADKGNISIICQDGLENREITLEVKDAAIEEVLSSVARRIGVEVSRVGSVYYVGSLRREDRGVLVRRVRRLDKTQVTEAVGVVMSDVGKVVSYSDGLLIVSDRVEMLQRIGSMLDQVESAAASVWVVQLYLIRDMQSKTKVFGVDQTAAIEISTVLAKAAQGTLAYTQEIAGEVTHLINVEASKSDSCVINKPLLVLLDGESAEIHSGEVIPVPKRAVSDQGTSTTTEYQEVQAGTSIMLSLRGLGGDRARVQLEIEMSTVTGYVQDAPIKSSEQMKTVTVINSGGVYLLGEMAKAEKRRERRGMLSTYFNKTKSEGGIQIWLRAYQIRGSVEGLAEASVEPELEALEIPGYQCN